MNILKSEKGALLVYALFLILLISVLTLPLLSISSTRDLAELHDHNQKVANNLVVSIAEDYLNYLSQCKKCDDPDYYKKFEAANESRQFYLPDGTPITYRIFFEENDSVVAFTVVAGDTDFNNNANEKFAHAKTIKYSLNGETSSGNAPWNGTLIDDNHPIIPISNSIYFGSGFSSDWDWLKDPNDWRMRANWFPPDTKPYTGPPIKPQLQNLMDLRSNNIETLATKKINDYVNRSDALTCTLCTFDKLETLINGSNQNPVIIKAGSINYSATTITKQLGSPTKKVVIIFDKLTTGNTLNLTVYGDFIARDKVNFKNSTYLNIYGDFIAKELDAGGNPFRFNQDRPDNNSNFWVLGNAILHNTTTLYAGETVYMAKDLTIRSDIDLKSNNLIVKEELEINNTSFFNTKKEILVGNATVKGNSELITQKSDFFVVNQYYSSNNPHLKIGGSFAVGGGFEMRGKPSTFSVGYQYDANGKLLCQDNKTNPCRPIPGVSIFNYQILKPEEGGPGGTPTPVEGNQGSKKTTWTPTRKK